MSDDYINKIIYTNLEMLIKKENVIGAVCGNKIINGIDTGEKCIVVFVSKKLPKTSLSPSNLIPNELQEIKTDVIALGSLKSKF